MTLRMLWMSLLAGFLALGLAAPATSAEPAFSAAQKAEVEKIIRDYLLKNPELLEEVTAELEKRRKTLAEAEAKQRLSEYKAEIYQSKYDFVDNADGVVPIVEFFDYQCGYCKRVFPSVKKLRSAQKDVRFIYKEFPILGPVSVFAARAAIASRYQNKYIDFHDALMTHRGRLNEDVIMKLAEGVGLDTGQLKSDMARQEVQEAIDANFDLAQRMKIRGTPAMIIGKTLIPGAIAYRQMVRLIEQARTNN